MEVLKRHRIRYSPEIDPMIEKFSFSQEDLSLLADYIEYIDEWHKLGISPSSLSSSFSMNYERSLGTQFASSPPDPTQFAALCTAIRPFILAKELTYFFRIIGILSRSTDSPLFRQLIKFFSNRYQGKAAPIIEFKAGGKKIAHESMIQHYLNGYVYHRDPESRELLQSFMGGLPREVQKTYFGMLIVDRAQVIGVVGILVRGILADDLQKLTNVE